MSRSSSGSSRDKLVHDDLLVERQPGCPDDLICLMTFAGEQHDIACMRLRKRTLNRRFPFCDSLMSARRHPLLDVIENLLWIFSTRIVIRNDDDISARFGGSSHFGTLPAVAIAATS